MANNGWWMVRENQSDLLFVWEKNLFVGVERDDDEKERERNYYFLGGFWL